MFTNASCTVWEKTVQNRSPTYIKHEIGAVYWEELRGETEGKSRDPEDKVLVIIHPSELGGYLPKKEDRIMRGYSKSEQPEHNALTVTAVFDLLFGTPNVQHIEITAK